MKSSAADLFCQDGPLHHEHRECIGDDHADKQRQESNEVMSEFERENDSGEWHTHRAAKYGAHTDKRPEPYTFIWEKHRLHSSVRSNDDDKLHHNSTRI